MTGKQKKNNHKRWNIFSLKEYFDFAMYTLNEKFDDKSENIEEKIETAKSELDRRLEGMNEFRKQLEKQEANFMTRSEYDTKHELLQAKLDAMQKLVYVGLGILLALELLFKFLIT